MLFTQTGGLIYHLRAWRQRETLWSPFREELGRWLSDWKPPESRLLLIGPSAGHCLEERFMKRFEGLSAVDPDPLARWLFRRRFGREVDWSREDYFSPRRGRFDPDQVYRLLARYPDHAVLFCNFLGQLPFLSPRRELERSYANWKRALPELLRDRSWASFHDRFSGPLEPSFQGTSRGFADCVSEKEILSELYPEPSGSRDIELADHLTGDLFPGRPRRFFRWEITPGNWHLIEGVQS